MEEEWGCSALGTSANDSGVSTIDSTCSVQLQLNSPAHKDTIVEILMNEHNNNVTAQIDVVKLLELKSTDEDDDDQHSNSSSLESITSLRNHQGSQERDDEEDDGGSGSTSCSEDSFEMSSACSIQQANGKRCKPSSSYSVDSFIAAAKKAAFKPVSPSFEKIRSRVANQIDQLDTGLPNLDFDKLEKQLTTAAQEREDLERRMLGEEVCYMNEMSESETDNDDDDDDDESEDDSDIECMVRKSKSAPNLKNALKSSNREAQKIKQITEKLHRDEDLTNEDRAALLKFENQRVTFIAKNKADTSLSDYRRGKSKASDVPRQARQYLSKMKIREIDAIRQLIENAIAKKNMELVQLLLERDSLHMEHDSLRVDIDDLTQQDQASRMDFKQLLKLQEDIENVQIETPRIEYPKQLPIEKKPDTTKKPVTPVTPMTTPTTPTISLSSVFPPSFSISSLFKR
ncbi:unnamed protein product [Caenorhabditis bovis]|uniref:Schwannomin interacting protein 1 C-terminal domain-containing protein n=1 Tax=Caenorhabditis bovis TaxID=2654633 RepID=A0A8S1FBS4_9PELO|nr:unnamed protein product [Caenorhabditis bovis]